MTRRNGKSNGRVALASLISGLLAIPHLEGPTTADNKATLQHFVTSDQPFEFDRIYGAWSGKVVFTDAKAAVKQSADRYVRALEN